jgi:hypothetical protein
VGLKAKDGKVEQENLKERDNVVTIKGTKCYGR